ncbi:glycosyl transferase [Flavobacteriales bacterium ALC-1]|nr:glycosyl transferase [Flavobacteriales bacterium ALC-1]
MKKVSVIITTYNRAAYLKLTLDSVVNQTYDNLEIIVIDDGSKNTKAETLCNSYQNVRYIKIKNSGGPAQPRNVGIENVSGEYVAFLDDDDIWLPTKIEQQVKILDENKEFGLVHSFCDVIDEDGNIKGYSVGRPNDRSVKHGDVKLKMIGNWTLMMPTPLLRYSLINEVGLFNVNIPSALEDVEFWTRCSFFTKFYYLDLPLANYRIHSSNISASNKNYADLPVYLKNVLKHQLLGKRITKKEHSELLLNVNLSQAKNINKYPLKTFVNLFKINPFWMINFRVIKVIIKRIIK